MEIETGFQGHTGGEICHFKLINYRYLTTQHLGDTLMATHGSEFIFDFVSLEINSDPLV